jgi:hypothetical protein
LFLIKKTIKKITFGHANDLIALEVFCPISLKDDWNNAISLRNLNSFGFINIQTKRQDGSLIGLAEAVEENLKLKINKTWTISAWAARKLLPEQIKYAAIDAFILLKLHKCIESAEYEFINEFIDENEFEYDFTHSNQISSISKFDQKNSNLNKVTEKSLDQYDKYFVFGLNI